MSAARTDLRRAAPTPEVVEAETPERPAPVPAIAWVGGAIVALVAILALTAPILAGYRPTELAGDPLSPPGYGHLLGTNSVGQDLASQLLHGARVSLFVALAAATVGVLIATLVGTTAGWLGGRTDAVLMRFVDVALVIPGLPLLIVLGAYAGASLPAIALIIALTSWPAPSRVVRAQVLTLRARSHLRAAVGFGAGPGHVLRRHVVPEVGLILGASYVGLAGRAVMLEAGLAFLGLGDPTTPSWGRVMREALGFEALSDTAAWTWWLVPPAIAVGLLVLGLTFVGLGFEQRVNPRLARHTG